MAIVEEFVSAMSTMTAFINTEINNVFIWNAKLYSWCPGVEAQNNNVAKFHEE